MKPIYITKTLAAASANAICLSQTPGAAGALTLNGASVSGGVATLDTSRQVLLTFAANETGHNFVITGTNSTGNVISETIAGTGIGTVGSVNNYLTVTSVTISAAATGAIQVGTSTTGATDWKNVDFYQTPFQLAVGCVLVSGSVTFSLQYTYDDFWTVGPGNTPPAPPTAFTDAAISGATATADTTINGPITGWRVQITSGTGVLAIKAIQATFAP